MPKTIVLGPSGPSREPEVGIARATVFSGIAFAVLFTAGLVLVNQIPRLDSPDSTYTAFYATGSGGVRRWACTWCRSRASSFALVRSARTRAGSAPAAEVLKE